MINIQEIKNKNILIVDDEKELLNILSDILYKKDFYNIYKASDCNGAIEIAKRQPISLYLLDVNLSDDDGFSLFEELNGFSAAT